jgi:imidazoleglycerol-phosphate dehydratase
MMDRHATIERNTFETQITTQVDLDGTGQANFETGLPFFEHMLEQVAKHGGIDLKIMAKGDLHIDAHHTVEDVGITLGQAFAQAIGDKRSIRRYGHAYVPLDESLSRVVVDFSGRPHLEFHVNFSSTHIGNFETELFYEFFQGFVNHAQITLHIDSIRGRNNHHIIETIFKAFGRAIRMAVEYDPKMQNKVPSTKGSL